ncbi:uncharacterized protein LOC131056772 [Cryptomeria japonica]|uniref:uncharacterized protein LOC131056772 n=1 Tax=Cryptomeria japonica TaxID=3369 RepID=UPI0027DA6AA3|nr:uncharacterized protein LOC131056772 [Cryptomeria japonica]
MELGGIRGGRKVGSGDDGRKGSKYERKGGWTKGKLGNGKVGAIRWVANHFHHNHPLWIHYIQEKVNASYTEDQRKDLIIKWEDQLVKNVTPLRQNKPKTTFGSGESNSDLQVEFSMWVSGTEKSAEDVIKDANHTPKWELVLSVALVSLYSVLAFNNIKDPVHSHTMLVLMGMVVVSFSILAGFGLTAAFGIKFTPLAASVVPFLTIGLGIDDIFVLTNILRSSLKNPKLKFINNTGSSKPENEMRFTVALAGPSLVLTTFSILASFFISSMNPMPIVQWFCWQMGITASIHTCGMLLVFIPLMSIDARRVKAGIVDPCLWPFCGLHRNKGLNGNINNNPLVHSTKSIKDDVHVTFEGHEGSSLLSSLVTKYYTPLFHNNVFKIGVVIVFSGLLGSMIYLGTKVEHGLKISEVTVTGSYQHDYAVVTENGFPVYDIWIVTSSLDYANSQPQLLDIYKTMQELKPWAPAQPKVLELSWLGNLYLARNQSVIPPQQFYTAIQEWSQTPYGLLSMQDLACYDSSTNKALSCIAEGNNSNYRISATKSLLFASGLGAETKPNLDMIKQTRNALDSANRRHFNGTKLSYAYGYPYLFFEQYLHSIKDMLTVVGFALVGVFVAVLLFQCSFTIALMIAVVLLMVDVEVFGFLYVIGAKLNSLSLVNLGIVKQILNATNSVIMIFHILHIFKRKPEISAINTSYKAYRAYFYQQIGMSSELTYLARCFLVIDGTKNERVGRALQWTFEPLLHGLGTQIAATLPLIFLKYHAFRLYYFAMFTIMGILGFLNGFVLLPVLLTWLGPPPLPHVKREHADTIDGTNRTSSDGHPMTGYGHADHDKPDDDNSATFSQLPILTTDTTSSNTGA